MADSDITIVGLTAIGGVNQIVLQWAVNDPYISAQDYFRFDHAEVWAADTVAMTGATRIDGGNAFTAFGHLPLARGVTRYYQVRGVDRSDRVGEFCSPVGATEISGDVLLETNGYWKHPSGLIFQWGQFTTYNGPTPGAGISVGFSFAFPNEIFSLLLTPVPLPLDAAIYSAWASEFGDPAGFIAFSAKQLNDVTTWGGGFTCHYQALGY